MKKERWDVLHAEANAMTKSQDQQSCEGALLAITLSPCKGAVS
jgi:pyrimidine deaminase RibD-like protein